MAMSTPSIILDTLIMFFLTLLSIILVFYKRIISNKLKSLFKL